MPRFDGQVLRFRRNRFHARFPKDYFYTASHFWFREHAPGRLHIGMTDFATRMLGEVVEFDFEVEPGNEVRPGEVVGWMEGFKAVTDIYCVAAGTFLGPNPAALNDPGLICKDCYGEGWLYAVEGEGDPRRMTVEEYAKHLNETIDKLEQKPWQSGEESD